MVFEPFSSGKSFLHRYDPKCKIIVSTTFSILTALLDRPVVLLFALMFAFCLSFIAMLDLKQLIKRLFFVNGFIVFLWLFLPFTCTGECVFFLGSLCVTYDGIWKALEITIKSNTIILATIALLGTSNIFSLIHALRHLKFPEKLVHLFFFSFRYIHVLQQEWKRLFSAAKIRNFQAKTNLHTIRIFAYLVGMLLVNSYDRSNRIYQAMLCRGFHDKYYFLNYTKTSLSDIAALAVMLLCIGVLGIMQWGIIL